MRFASMTSSAAVSSLWRPTSARKSCRLSAEPEIATVGAGASSCAGSAGFSLSSLAVSPGGAAAAGAPISSPVRSSSRVSSSRSSSFSSSSLANASISAGSTKPRSSAPSTIARIWSDSSSSWSWFCVRVLSVLSSCLVALEAFSP
jgi:hypothetical protein